jgi:uncharacterized protein
VIVIADTSGIIAASDRKAAESVDCQSVLREAGTVVISRLVLAEVDHMAKACFGSAARIKIITFIVANGYGSRSRICPLGSWKRRAPYSDVMSIWTWTSPTR